MSGPPDAADGQASESRDCSRPPSEGTPGTADDSEARPGPEAPADSDRFLLDVMLGKLAVYLRMCGYDTAYALDRGLEDDDDLAAAAAGDDRWLVTRDRSLAARVDGALLVSSREVAGQLAELAAAGVDLSLSERPVRCGRCNGSLTRVSDDAGVPEYAPDPRETAVWRCRDCGQHFWQGSHWDDVRDRLDGLGVDDEPERG